MFIGLDYQPIAVMAMVIVVLLIIERFEEWRDKRKEGTR